MSTLTKLSVSDDCRYHTFADGTAAYHARFDEVLSFHGIDNAYQVAPVFLNGQAWHIDETGEAIYPHKFRRTFGFYCGLAAVIENDDWFHISPNGFAIYAQRYAFVGNYQQNIAVVCDRDGFYFHIDKSGQPLYENKWHYCGDFREGIAVAQAENGLSTHIDKQGRFIHSFWFLDLDVFHKRFARAKSDDGWHHIDKNGKPIYAQRYASVEPFYNGFSRVETFSGALQIIDEQGDVVRELRAANNDDFGALSADMVGYWRTFTIATAADLKIFDYLPNDTSQLAIQTNTLEKRLTRLLNALGELGLVKCEQTVWHVLPKGAFLTTNHTMSLASAATEYRGELMQRWHNLTQLMQEDIENVDIFKQVSLSDEHTAMHHNMLRSYALKDYQELVCYLDIEKGDVVFDAAGGVGSLAQLILDQFPSTNVILGDLQGVINSSNFSNKIAFDLFETWPVKAEKIMLARVLHDWNDADALQILLNAADALQNNGAIYVFEMLLDEHSFGGSLCDLHLLTVTGGQERTKSQFEALFKKAGLCINTVIKKDSLVTAMKLIRE
ncbi:methyltransferase [Celerinatantimonas yamalensis]|uniref:Methyltransferase n=1 Tax=Celerinatantimonas yamalensis TaxID=559956 RepID=A0ABW9GCK5_9GAMM